ncbi:hypothetical protein H4219_006030 [Mycoemilia scoparia]|uniref:J domain-containing protein n=1 Tax=Mycoemilia scoparia TaxID=417184 RepID=A0A9W8DJU8_9FUNG|nr:hypothetical protein H4219_006030 [Mycoemilia scoparia]
MDSVFQFSTVSAGNSNINSSEEQKLEKQIRQSAKRLMKIYHPDKIGGGGGGGDHSHYLLIQHAYSTLKDPTKRFAYDRFGPDFFVKCPECRTRLEYSQFFVKDIVIKHSVHVGVILLLRLLTGSNNNGNGNSNRNGFMTQRFYALLLLMITEAQVAIRNDMNLLNGLLGRWLIPIGNHFGIKTPFEAFFVLTEISMSLFYAIEYMWITIISTSNSIKNSKHQNDVAKSGNTSQEYHETQLYIDSFKDMSTNDLIEDLCETNATLLREIRLLQYQETAPFGGGGEKDKLKKLLNGIIEEILEKNPNLSKETLQLVKSSLKKQLKQGLKAPPINKTNQTKQQEISQ